MEQREAEITQVVSVGTKLFGELADRTRMAKAEVQVYREAVMEWAVREGIEVPEFVGDDGGGGAGEAGAGSLEQLREWLGRVLSGLSVAEGKPGVSRGGRGRGSRSRGRGEGRIPTVRGKRAREEAEAGAGEGRSKEG